jgi:hypothetical protein
MERRENLAWRVRIAASFIDTLVAHHIPFRLFIDGLLRLNGVGGQAREASFDLLSEIPLDGLNPGGGIPFGKAETSFHASRWRISATSISGEPLAAHHVSLRIDQAGAGIRSLDSNIHRLIHLDEDIATQMSYLLMEVNRESCSA